MFLLQNNPLIAEVSILLSVAGVIVSIKGHQMIISRKRNFVKIGCVIAIATVATERLRGCGRLDSMFFPQSGSAE